ncbi:MAG: NADP-dependent phosphogluconate dehydrogenase [Planctomycetes bacterium]|nr:NADP-dependent phosphogluconate dehydrogenase [Planctomycetota bacterium]
MGDAQFGLIGLAVMGQNLVLNVERNGFKVAVYNRTTSKMEEFLAENKGKKLVGGKTIEEFVKLQAAPRKIMIMVKAGAAVDETIKQLLPHLEKGDTIIDGGNSYYADTERRNKELEQSGIHFIGTGVSGGEFGALWGPSIMPGGQKEAWLNVKPVFEAISAKVNGEPCVTYIGPRGAGHFVKTVHNGIEYGDMQLIAEVYDVLKRAGGVQPPEFHEIFKAWNENELSSYLIEITRDIFLKKDDATGKYVVDLILDEAQGKGTGKWTSQNALDLGVPIPTINAAVVARIISSYKAERVKASEILRGPAVKPVADKKQLIEDCRAALYAAKICSYAQGLAMLKAASNEFKYDLKLGEIARIWRGGCIIRAKLLEDIRAAFAKNPNLENLLLDPAFKEAVESRQEAMRRVVGLGVAQGIPLPGLSESLMYFDAYRTARLPANLVQAQRDYFGAHTYRRTDKDGSFHTEWMPGK